jgi:hypothetical protein
MLGGLGDVVHGTDAGRGDGLGAVADITGRVVELLGEVRRERLDASTDTVLASSALSSSFATLSSLGALVRALVGRSSSRRGARGKDDTGRDEVDVAGNVSRQVVLVGADVLPTRLDVVVHVVACMEDGLELAGSCLELDPGSTGGDVDVTLLDARVDEPLADGVDGRLFRGEELPDLLLIVVLSVSLGLGVGAARVSVTFFFLISYSRLRSS